MDSPQAKRRRRSGDDEFDTSLSVSKLEKLSPVVVFAHGAGAPSSSDWMIRWKDMLEEALHAAEVVTFDYPYISGGKRRAPPKAEKLVGFHLDIVKKTAAKYPDHPLILVGKSMGSRVGCLVASSEEINVSAIVCLGPLFLHPSIHSLGLSQYFTNLVCMWNMYNTNNHTYI